MSEAERCTLSDEELEALDIRIPDSETDASFFEWIDNMIQETFAEDDN